MDSQQTTKQKQEVITMMYDYRKAIEEDIKEYIEENKEEILKDMEVESLEDADSLDLEEQLRDILWIEDSVTGNGSGSYTFDMEEAKKNVLSVLDYDPELVEDAFTELGCIDELGKKVLGGEWEYIDVTIRCYLLGEVIGTVLGEIQGE